MLRAVVLLVVGFWCASCVPRPAGVPGPMGGFAALVPFYEALAALEAGGRSRVAVLQVGDSHTANDAFSGRMRELMQARFGDGGRGLLPPGIPFRYYRPRGVQVSAEGWEIRRGGVRLGFAGLQQQAAGPAVMTVAAAPPGLSRVVVEVAGQPGGGTLDMVASDGGRASVSTAGEVGSVLRVVAPAGAGSTYLEVRARGDGPVGVLSWTAEAPGPGLTWSNLGTIGATVAVMGGWDAVVMAGEAAGLGPSLVVLAFGTNEGFKDTTDLVVYPGQVRAAIQALRRAAPGAAVVVAGPPGGVRSGGAGTACADRAGWVVPANLPRVRAIEREVAAAEGAFFWDWAAAMGGDCMIVPWAETDPPMAARDHVHLLQPGYRRTAEALFGVLMEGYERYRLRAGGS